MWVMFRLWWLGRVVMFYLSDMSFDLLGRAAELGQASGDVLRWITYPNPFHHD